MDDGREDDLPLHEEAEAREKWRGGETRLEDDGSGDTHLPASEADDARLSPKGDVDDDGRPGKGSPGTIAPPD